MSKIETYKCDIQGCKNNADFHMQQQLQVIFTTEQTEGRHSDPYLEIVKLDICEDCMNRVLNGEPIFAQGAQGYNKYYF